MNLLPETSDEHRQWKMCLLDEDHSKKLM